MPVNVETDINLQSESVRKFIRSIDATYENPVDSEFLKLLNLEIRADYNFQVPPEEEYLITAIRRHYHIIKNRTRVAKTTVIIPERHKVEVRLIGKLLVKKNIDEKIKSEIERGFNEYDPQKNPDIQKYAENFVNRSSLNISNDDYYLLYTFHLTKKPPIDKDYSQEKALRSKFKEGELVHVRDENLDFVPRDPVNDDGVIEVPDINDGKHIEEKIGEAIEDNINSSPCDELTHINKRIVQVAWYPEFETRTSCKNKWLCCIKTRICTDNLYTRESRVILYASLVYSWNDRRFLKIFEHCLVKSATASTIIGIVTENFAAAVYAFQVLFLECIEDKALEELECLVPDLHLITQRSTWGPVW